MPRIFLVNQWIEYYDRIENPVISHAYQVPVELPSGRGRPWLFVTQSQLEYLHSLCFSWSEIAAILGTSPA